MITVIEFGTVNATATGIILTFTVKSTRQPGSVRTFEVPVTEAQVAAQIGSVGQEKTPTDLLNQIVQSRKTQFADFFQSGDTVIILGSSIQVRSIA